MSTLTIILLAIACVLFVLASLGVPAGRFQLGWLGAAVLTLSLILPHV